jgi:exodeoxyribonuclease V gamma subunit
MIELIYSNKTERLLGELARVLGEERANGAHPRDPVQLVVPNRNMETYVRLGLAQSLGVAVGWNRQKLICMALKFFSNTRSTT